MPSPNQNVALERNDGFPAFFLSVCSFQKLSLIAIQNWYQFSGVLRFTFEEKTS